MLIAKGIKKAYGNLQVLKGVDLEIQKKEVISIVGASGAGKSTLLHILGTLDKADEGNVEIEGQHISDFTSHQIARFRNQRVGFIFQFHNLLPEFTALENVMIPAFINKQSNKVAEQKAMKILKMLDVHQRSGNKPSELSGGEQQRVSVARALINDPTILFADEPSGNLDSENANELHQLFFKLRSDLDQTIVIVTHNEQLAAMADRTLVMKDGLIHPHSVN